jgi:soluble lytic murein transglycosylase-like protein
MSSIAAITARVTAIEARLAAHRRFTTAETAPAPASSLGMGAVGAPTATGSVAGSLGLTGTDLAGGVPRPSGLYSAIAEQTEAALEAGLLFDPTARASYATGPSPTWAGGVNAMTNVVPLGDLTPVRGDVPYASLFNAAGARYGVPPTVLAGMGHVESRFRLDAVSSAGALGMMQFLPGTAAEMGVDPWDPASAVDGAARYVRNALDRFGGSLEMAVGAYNIGPGAMARAGSVLPGSQAERYVNLVMRAAERMS